LVETIEEEILRNEIFRGWNKYYEITKLKRDFHFGKNNHMITKFKKNRRLSRDEFENIFTFKEYIILYNNIRNIEEDNVFSKSDVDRFSKNATEHIKYFDKNDVIGYINEQYRSTFKSKPGGFNYWRKKLKDEMTEDT